MNERPLSEHLQALLRSVLPGVQCLLLLLLSVLPTGIPYFSVVMPMLVLIGVYYWSLYRPDLMPMPLVFVFGVLLDILSGGPLGLMALLLLLVHGICVSQRQVLANKSFYVGWFGFTVVAIGVNLVGWIVACAFFLALLSPVPVIVQTIVTIAVYPLFARLFGRSEQVFLQAA
jgi:rod shape-determining protein MreD